MSDHATAAIPTYMGQRTDMGKIEPTSMFPNEGFATLRCGNTEVVLTYTELERICGHLAIGACGDPNVQAWGAVQRAIQAVTCEASLGRTP
jgi:hypothetical protein